MRDQPVLAFDCSTAIGTVALRVGGVTDGLILGHNRQAVELVSGIDLLMRRHTVAYADLGTLITTVGPGSFTGLRIGLATLHGLALATRVPVKTTGSLEALAWEVALGDNPPAEFHTGLRAGRGEAYMQRFRLVGGAPRAIDGIFLCAEDAAAGYHPYFGNLQPPESPCYRASPSARVLCAIAERLPTTLLAEALPVYVRPPDALIPAKPAWLV